MTKPEQLETRLSGVILEKSRLLDRPRAASTHDLRLCLFDLRKDVLLGFLALLEQSDEPIIVKENVRVVSPVSAAWEEGFNEGYARAEAKVLAALGKKKP